MQDSRVFFTSSWDDVTKLDLKLCELLERYGIKGTFFAVGNWIGKEISADELRHISESHEVGAHTLNHVDLTRVSMDVAKREIFESKSSLESTLGKRVTSFAYPKGHYRKTHTELARDAGYACARTVRPFYTRMADNPFEMNVTIWAYPHRLRSLGGLLRLFSLSPSLVVNPLRIKRWDELGKRIFDILLERGGGFHLFGHAWQVDEINGWKKLEALLAHVADRKNVACVTMSEYAGSHFGLAC